MTPKVLLIEQTSKKTKERFRASAKKSGFDIDFATWKKVQVDTSKKDAITVNGKELGEYDLIYIRIVENLYAQAALVAHAAEKLGIRIVDGSLLFDIQSADTKIEQVLRCALSGIPTPITFYSPNYEELLQMTNGMKFPLVLKVVNLHRGQGVFLVNSKEEIKKYFEEKGENGQRDFLIQEKIDYIRDYRIIVIGGKILGAIERQARTGEFRSNISLGGRANKVEKIDPKLAEIAENAANIMHLDIAGVDVIEDKIGNYFLIEINRAPQTRGFEEATGIDTLKAIFEYFKSLI